MNNRHQWQLGQSVHFKGHLISQKIQQLDTRLNFITIAFRPKKSAPQGDWDLKLAKHAAAEMHLPLVQGQTETTVNVSDKTLELGTYQVRIYFNTIDIFGGTGDAKLSLLGTAEVEVIESSQSS